MVKKHIWVCEDDPQKFWAIDVDEQTWTTFPNIERELTEKMTGMLTSDHKHIFEDAVWDPRESVIVHKCPGLDMVMATIILGGGDDD